MKLNTPALVLGCLVASMICFGQENPTPPAPAEAAPAAAPAEATPAPPPSPPPVVPAPDAAPPPVAPTGDAESTTNAPARPGEVVPLIVIDEVPLTDAIRNLARQSNLNFQFDPRVTTSNQPMVTIRFENVTAEEALEAVLDNYNLQLVREPSSRIARVTYRVPKAEEPLYSRIVQLKYSDPTNMVSLVKATLSTRSSVLADPRTSQLIVTTTLKEMESAVALIEKLDTPTKQVLIEAKLLETGQSPTSIKGIDWSGTLEAQQFRMGNNLLDNTGGEKTLPGQNSTLPRALFGPRPAPNTAFLDADGVSAVLSFLNKDTDTEVVATPRAVTLDNQTATLAVTRAIPILNVTPGSVNVAGGSQIQYTNLGVILNVTPRIAADNNIALRVVPEVSNVDGKDAQEVQGEIYTANIYAIRKIETQVLIPSGTTLVMGGLINDTRTKAYTKVPLLGDLPAIGLAFRKEEKRRNKTNLMIFITPTIVDEEAFQLTSSGTDFLKTRISESPEPKETAWDSAKPHDWTKPVY